DLYHRLTAYAQLVAHSVHLDETCLDMTAGPGVKDAILASLAATRGATLRANDVSDHRTKLVEQALRVVDENVWTTSVADGVHMGNDPDNAQRFDRILLDAPCTR